MELRRVRSVLLGATLLAGVAALLSGCADYEARKDAHLAKGQQLFEAGDDARATLELKNALQIDQKLAPAWYWLGRIEERSGDTRKAFGAYARAIELDPTHVPARVRHGRFLALSNDLEAARQDAAEALRLAPDDPDALALRAVIRQKSGDLTAAWLMPRRRSPQPGCSHSTRLVEAAGAASLIRAS